MDGVFSTSPALLSRNEIFKEFAGDVAMQVTLGVGEASRDDVWQQELGCSRSNSVPPLSNDGLEGQEICNFAFWVIVYVWL